MKRITKKSGFTLIELVVVIALLGIFVVMLSSFVASGYKSYRLGRERVVANEAVTKAVSDFEKIARGATRVLVADDQNIVFYAYLKGDNNPSPSKIGYYTTGNIFYRSMIKPVVSGQDILYPDADKVETKLAQDLTAPATFQFYSDANIELALPLQLDVIKAARITLTVDKDVAAPPEAATQSTLIEFRNLKTNL